jgi:DNA-binding GntR family transcriptional regulator
MLQEQGFVTSERNQRPRVATFSTEKLEAVFAQRILLGALCTKLTVPQLSTADVDRMGRLIDDMAEAELDEDPERWRQIDDAFHHSHYAHASDALKADLLNLNERAQLFRYTWYSQRRSTVALTDDDHESIHEACADGDAQKAARLVARHFATIAIALLARSDPTHEPTAIREALRTAMYSND